MTGNSVVSWECASPPYAKVDVMQSSSGLLDSLMAGSARSRRETARDALFIILPGNPCIVECYAEFASILESSHRADVLVFGYAGHSLSPHNANRLFSLQDQIDLCQAFFSKLFSLSASAKSQYGKGIYLVGHSIGAFVALQMLSRFSSHIKLFFGLAPVLSHIQASPNGRNCAIMGVPVLQHVAAFVGSTLALLPRSLKQFITRSYAKQVNPELRTELTQRVHRAQLHNIIHMTIDEFRMVREPDWFMLQSLQEKMILYYVPHDHWAPEQHAYEIRCGCPQLRAFIMEDVSLHVSHAWCLADNEVVVRHAISPFL